MHIYEQNKLIISGCWLYKQFLFCLFVIYYFKMLTPWKNSYNKSRQCIKKADNRLVDKNPSSQNYVFSRTHVWMWKLDHKEAWAPEKWHFWTVVLEKTLERPLDCKEIKPVNPKGNQPWIFTEGLMLKTEAPVLWPPDVKSWLTREDPDARKNWVEEKGATEEMASLTQWILVWANSRRWRRTEKPGVLQFMGFQRVGQLLLAELKNNKIFL